MKFAKLVAGAHLRWRCIKSLQEHPVLRGCRCGKVELPELLTNTKLQTQGFDDRSKLRHADSNSLCVLRCRIHGRSSWFKFYKCQTVEIIRIYNFCFSGPRLHCRSRPAQRQAGVSASCSNDQLEEHAVQVQSQHHCCFEYKEKWNKIQRYVL